MQVLQPFLCSLFSQKSFTILFSQIKYIVHIRKCKLPIKQMKMKEVLGGGGGGLNLASLNCAFLPWACKYELQAIFYFEAALLHYIGHFFEEYILVYWAEL